MKATRLRVYLAFAAVFVLGAAAGGGAVYAHLTRIFLAADESGELRDRRRLEALKRELDLSRAQSERVLQIFARYRPEHRKLVRAAFERCGDPLREEKQKMDAEIRAQLDPDQQRRFDEVVRIAREKFPYGPKGQ
ncbi:MAG: hypothetical protein ACOY0T_16275 [Myxococcota bacterium]